MQPMQTPWREGYGERRAVGKPSLPSHHDLLNADVKEDSQVCMP